MPSTRSPYPTDVNDEEWAFVVPYLTLLSEAASQRRHDLREVYNGVRYIVKTGAHWRNMPHDLLPWRATMNAWPQPWQGIISSRSRA